MVFDGVAHQVVEEMPAEQREERPAAPSDPLVALARKMSAAAHRMVQTSLKDDEDEDPFDDELGLRRMSNADGEER